jgi:hypothetical protein
VREPWTVLAKRDPPRMFHVELFPVIPITGNKQLEENQTLTSIRGPWSMRIIVKRSRVGLKRVM